MKKNAKQLQTLISTNGGIWAPTFSDKVRSRLVTLLYSPFDSNCVVHALHFRCAFLNDVDFDDADGRNVTDFGEPLCLLVF